MAMHPIDDRDGGHRPPRNLLGRLRRVGFPLKVTVVSAALLVFYLSLDFLRDAYTDWLWFTNVGFTNVYRTVLFTKVWLFTGGLLVSGATLGFAYRAAYRTAWGPTMLPVSARAASWISRSLVAGTSMMGVLIAFSFASGLSNRYDLFLRHLNSTSFGMADPQFGVDVGFYLFTLPMLHTIQGWLMGLAIVVIVTTTGIYLLIFSARGINPSLTPGARTQLAIASAALMGTIAVAHFLDRFETLFSSSGAVTGSTYADVNARLPALILLALLALISAALMLLAIKITNLRQSLRLIVSAFGLWAIAALLAGLAWPALTQRLAVTPTELQRERVYIERHIGWTRLGFDLDRIAERPYSVSGETLALDIAANPDTIQNIRLWDPRPLEAVLNQLQHLRLYYSFLDVDVDRYVVDGDYRQVLVGTRELFQNGLDDSAQNWVNRSLVYTHGYGLVMSTATEFNKAGQPRFVVRDVPTVGSFEIREPRIYFGEAFGIDHERYADFLNLSADDTATLRRGIITNDAVIVNTTEPQFDKPAEGPSNLPEFIEEYRGAGGVALSNPVRRLAYSWELLDPNIVLSRQLTNDSRILYRRNIAERVRTVAPFLELDDDPYLVVHDGRLYWIQDAFTTTDKLPYSRAIGISRIGNNGDFDSFERPFNYIRNSVKVVVDAYNGTMDFYTLELFGIDPILQVYRNIFPGLFTPIDEMPPGLRAHIRYPEELLRAQADTFLQYHMTDVKEFFLKEDEWELAEEVVGAPEVVNGVESLRRRTITPYFVIMNLGGEETEEFVLILPFTPKDKPNLVAWMAARSDGDRYGEIIVFEFPKDRLFNGPSQIEARIDNDPSISEQFTLWNTSGSRVVRGNLLVIPLGQTLLFAEPIYLRATSLAFPELKRVILATNDKVVMEQTLDDAVLALLDDQQRESIPSGKPSAVGDFKSESLQQILENLLQALESLQGGASELEDSVDALRKIAGENS